jgi:hemerythrin-like domain-containing protein
LAQILRQSVERVQAGEVRKREAIVENATGYIKLIRQHIAKEDKVLFPMADKVIPTTQQEQILQALTQFERDEKGEDMHEKYYGLAARLEKECLR